MKRHRCIFQTARWTRVLVLVLIPTLLLTTVPREALVVAQAASSSAIARFRPALKVAPRRSAMSNVKANRTTPKAAGLAGALAFSSQPTAAEIGRARIFEEPLVPMGGRPSTRENKALAQTLLAYSRGDHEDPSAVDRFLAEFPQSVWRAALLANLGLTHRRAGRYSRALAAWEETWKLAKHEAEPKARVLLDRVGGELADLYARLGHEQRLAALLAELAGRDLQGSATEAMTAAREALWLMRNRPDEAFRCGAYALGRVQAALRPDEAVGTEIQNARATRQGMSLAQLGTLAEAAGLSYQMARREPDTRVPLPALVHWKLGHYAALIREENGRYLLQDPAAGHELRDQVWLSPAALDAEASGYFLIPEGPLPAGWRAVGEEEGRTVWGRGYTDDNCPDCDKPCDKKTGGGCPLGRCAASGGMAYYAFHGMLVSLNIVDTPVGYTPPRGPWMGFTVTYNQREANQPANFTYSNLGPKWTFDWLSYITDNPVMPMADVRLFVRGGGTETYRGFTPATQSYAPQLESRAVLVRTSPTSYERRLPDGSREIFSQSDGATAFPRKIFMTQSIDPAGNTVDFVYDESLRLVSAVDPLGQATNLSYDLEADPLKITSVTDPFGRFAAFEYDAAGRLVRITDVIGLTSEFSYGTGDFINAMTTPYGTTRFAFAGAGNSRWLEATDPLGDKERLEFRHSAPGIGTSDPVAPAGVAVLNQWLEYRNSFYWDKEAWARHPGDYTKARIFHWLHDLDTHFASGILESEKNPLENRVWYLYPGQTSPAGLGGSTHAQASKVARVLDDGTTQLYQYEYNALGKITRATDPVGRVTSYVYAANQIDLLEVRQARGSESDLLTRTTYNAQHQPLTVTDAAGQTTRYTYNSFGQVLTVTNPRNETTTYAYDENGYLLSVTGPLPEAVTRYTYDGYGRVYTKTDSEGYTLEFYYDDLDRKIFEIYPDGTFKQFVYNRLDLEESTDRLGRVTRTTHNPLRQIVAIQDAQKRMVRFEWCRCSGLQKIIDPLGRQTIFDYDVQGRLTRRVFPDGSQIRYAYDRAGRLIEITDANGRATTTEYYIDNTVKRTRQLNAKTPTQLVRFTYDASYNRVICMDDGTGRTTYSYHPVTAQPTLGAGRLASITGPLPNSTITYEYDELGRIVRRAINGVAESTTYDTLSRRVRAVNPLGTFTYSYVGATDRLSSITLPNGQRTMYSYYDQLADHRLQEIKHVDPAGAVISQFNYAYDAEGQITSWAKQLGAQPPAVYAFEYDGAGQLTAAVPVSKEAGPVRARAYFYQYDGGGNRLSEYIDDTVTLSNYNVVNQLVSQQAATLPEPDPAIHASEITYDGLRHRVRIIEKTDGAVTSDRRFLWCGMELCEERDGTGAAVTKRFYEQGMQVGRDNYFYTRDHLGSVRELTDAAGAIRASYDYDPYGRRTKIGGDLDADFAFTGHYCQASSGLNLAVYRAYDAQLGRWLIRDPIAEAGGQNLYGYTLNNPLQFQDLLGLSSCETECSDKKFNCKIECNNWVALCSVVPIAFGICAGIAGAAKAYGTAIPCAAGGAASGVVCKYISDGCRDQCDRDEGRCKDKCPKKCPGGP